MERSVLLSSLKSTVVVRTAWISIGIVFAATLVAYDRALRDTGEKYRRRVLETVMVGRSVSSVQGIRDGLRIPFVPGGRGSEEVLLVWVYDVDRCIACASNDVETWIGPYSNDALITVSVAHRDGNVLARQWSSHNETFGLYVSNMEEAMATPFKVPTMLMVIDHEGTIAMVTSEAPAECFWSLTQRLSAVAHAFLDR